MDQDKDTAKPDYTLDKYADEFLDTGRWASFSNQGGAVKAGKPSETAFSSSSCRN